MTASPASVPSPGIRMTRLATGGMAVAVAAALVFQAIFHLIFMGGRFAWDGETSMGEASVTERAHAFAHGEPLYRDYTHWPYLCAVYGPLTKIPVGAIARAIGLDGSRSEQGYLLLLLGRTQSAVGLALVLLWLWAMGGQLQMSWRWRIVALLLFFSCRPIVKFSYSFRPDVPQLALMLWAWWVALRGRNGTLAGVAAAILMYVSMFYKITFVTCAGSLFLWLVVSRQWRRAGAYAATGIACALLTLVVLTAATGTGWTRYVFGLHKTPIYFPAFYELLAGLRPAEAVPFIGGALAMLGLVRKAPGVGAVRFAFALAFVGSQLLVIHGGSNLYYYLEPYTWGSLLTALVLRDALSVLTGRRTTGAGRGARVAAACGLVLLFGLYGLRTRQLFSERSDLRPPERWARRHAEAVAELGTIRGPVLLYDAYPWWYTQAPRTMMRGFLFGGWVSTGRLTTDELVNKVRRHDFVRVVLNWKAGEKAVGYHGVDFLPPDVVEAVRQNYTFDGYKAPYYFYSPKR